MLVQIAVCKCHLKFDQQEGRGRCMSMQVDGGVAVNDLPMIYLYRGWSRRRRRLEATYKIM